MRIVPFLISILLAAPAAAQSDSVIVGGDGSGQTLIDPATGQSRYVPSLLQPWQDDAVRLRPPGHHRARKATTPATTAVTPSAEPEVAAAPPPPPKKKRIATVTPAPVQTPKPETPKPAAQPKPQPKSSISGFADIDLITGTGQQTQQAAPPKAASAPKAVASTPKPTKTASIEKPKKTPTGNRKDSITFTAGASEPSGSAVASVRSIATSLASGMGDSARVQLMAYAGAKGEKTSDTRRLSLKRALVVRQLLIDDGVPSERIDVFALGGADDDGPLDRVDVFVKS
jgi:outer membrane protein OmpA-like peptidoglycan-associated protein